MSFRLGGAFCTRRCERNVEVDLEFVLNGLAIRVFVLGLIGGQVEEVGDADAETEEQIP